MKFKDTLSGEIREFVPVSEGRVKLFVCGPTVYDHIQLGNARTFVFFDMFAKYLRARGYEVFYLQNITDLDDKILNRAREENRKWSDISDRYLESYLEDSRTLHLDSVSHHARATRYMPEMISQIERLIGKGYAYVSSDGVYFDTSKFPDYGKLSKQKLDQVEAGARVEVRISKRNPQDFVLWKFSDEEPFWDSPWGKGRPGWHIEDTAITEHYLGPEYDVHGGGTDLVFPHHEAEIAQMRAISGLPFLSRYWLHGAFLNFRGEKMSKSTGNIVRVKDLAMEYPGTAIRYFLLNSKYSSELLYNEEVFRASMEGWKRLQRAFLALMSEHSCSEACNIEKDSKDIIKLMDEDLDTRETIAKLHVIATEIFRGDLTPSKKRKYAHIYRFANSFLSIFAGEQRSLDKVVESLIALRNEFRERGMYPESDRIRARLREAGINLEDSGKETTWNVTG